VYRIIYTLSAASEQPALHTLLYHWAFGMTKALSRNLRYEAYTPKYGFDDTGSPWRIANIFSGIREKSRQFAFSKPIYPA